MLNSLLGLELQLALQILAGVSTQFALGNINNHTGASGLLHTQGPMLAYSQHYLNYNRNRDMETQWTRW